MDAIAYYIGYLFIFLSSLACFVFVMGCLVDYSYRNMLKVWSFRDLQKAMRQYRGEKDGE